ncbi:MAG: hypothetical protein ACJAXH_002650 [Colwellia sp.]|jgi:hypothetical protein
MLNLPQKKLTEVSFFNIYLFELATHCNTYQIQQGESLSLTIQLLHV